MVTREDIIQQLKSLGGITTEEGHYYRFETAYFNKEIKGGANGFILMAVAEHEIEVAVKFYFPRDPSDRKTETENDDYKRFINEIAILERADCEYLIKCFGKGAIDAHGGKVPFYVMPSAKGSMADILKEGKFNNVDFTYRFFYRLGLAIQYLHRQEINGEKCYHRDLKPQNVLFMESKEDEPLLADLGLAHINPKFAKFEVDSTRLWLRNPYYCAPEQIFGSAEEVDHRADIYAYGLMLREALTGEHPRGESAPLPSEKLGAEYVPIDNIIVKCTRYEKHERYQAMDECLRDLIVAFEGTTKEKEWMAAFYVARQKLAQLANQWPLTSELLPAGTLRTLYLRRVEYTPADRERIVIFNNLLLSGRKKHDTHRAKKIATGISVDAPASLGWFWFNEITQTEIITMLRQAVHHPNEFVRVGVARGLGKFGEASDQILLREMIKEHNANLVAMAIRSLALLGMQSEDVENIRQFHKDRRSEVRGAVAYALAKCGSQTDEPIIINMIDDENPSVRRDAIVALGIRYNKNPSLKEIALSKLTNVLDNPREPGTVLVPAKKVRCLIREEPFDHLDCYERRIVNRTQSNFRDETDIEFNRNKALRLLLMKKPQPEHEVAVRWIIKYEPHNVENIINEYGADLHFYALQKLDYLFYSPQWWRAAMDPPLAAELSAK